MITSIRIGATAAVVAGLLTGAASALAQTPPEAAPTEEVRAAPVNDYEAPQAPRSAAARRDVGWDTPFALLFDLHNIFQNPIILSSYQGFGVGGQYHLGPTTALRIGLDLARTTNPVNVTKVTTTTGSDQVVSYQLSGTGGPTSMHSLAVEADLLMRLSRGAIAPYVGGGARFDWNRMATSFTDDVTTVDQVTNVDNRDQSFGMGLAGILGIDWRIHENFAFFAEYNLGVDLARWTSSRAETTVTNTAGGVETTTQTKSEFDETRIFNYNLDLGQGAALGVIAFF